MVTKFYRLLIVAGALTQLKLDKPYMSSIHYWSELQRLNNLQLRIINELEDDEEILYAPTW
jgi:hypothetical protein